MNVDFDELFQGIIKGVMLLFLISVAFQMLLKATNVSDLSQLPITGPALEKFEMLFPNLSRIQDVGDTIGLIGFFSIFVLTTAGALYWKQKQEENQWRR